MELDVKKRKRNRKKKKRFHYVNFHVDERVQHFRNGFSTNAIIPILLRLAEKKI